ncbi:MAG: hypothetical protein GC160_10285 [Acidobacteria bacterium]|nr:hypothetical protein [Acidobacteriota bacterium]
MKQLALLAALALTVSAGLFAADHEYKKIATVHDIMEAIVKPNMDLLAEMKKSGGPSDEKQWKQANRAASIIGEGAELMLLDGRIKDQAWEDGAKMAIDGAQKSMTAAMRKDTNAWMESLNGIGGGCRTCHKVHKPKK